MSMPYILLAPNGARRTRVDHPKLPLTTEQIVAAAQSGAQAGANGLHLHVRDDSGRHSLDPGRYLETLTELSLKVASLDIQITTEAAGHYDVAQQLHCVETVRPTWVSIAMREIAREPDLAPRVYATCFEIGSKVQHILYDAQDALLMDQWLANGTVHAGQTDRLLVLGRYADRRSATPSEVDSRLRGHVHRGRTMVCAFGPHEHDCLCCAAQMGADVRLGFENSLTGSDGALWEDNAESVSTLLLKLKRNCHEPRVSSAHEV